jgi:hypothetical protein
MKGERKEFPDWANQDRQGDTEWIGENLHVFQPAASNAFKEYGRGAIVVDITSRPTGEGDPFGYFPQELVEAYEDEDINRMVREYNPEAELVVVLFKSENRTSTYRIKPQPRS